MAKASVSADAVGVAGVAAGPVGAAEAPFALSGLVAVGTGRLVPPLQAVSAVAPKSEVSPLRTSLRRVSKGR
ncbi:MAG TPA: hypothetical protein VFZ25_04805 [Chloroflexota bacterium]|nr:hypothetical protein [Chloroflexota bacterium]